MVEEFRTDVTKTRKDGTRGAYRVDYGDPRKPEKAIAWLWKYLDAASLGGRRPAGGRGAAVGQTRARLARCRALFRSSWLTHRGGREACGAICALRL